MSPSIFVGTKFKKDTGFGTSPSMHTCPVTSARQVTSLSELQSQSSVFLTVEQQRQVSLYPSPVSQVRQVSLVPSPCHLFPNTFMSMESRALRSSQTRIRVQRSMSSLILVPRMVEFATREKVRKLMRVEGSHLSLISKHIFASKRRRDKCFVTRVHFFTHVQTCSCQ